MKKLLTIVTVTLLSIGVVSAQTRIVSGRVVDSKGAAVPGATVKVKGGAAVAADDKGDFKIDAQTGDVLTITSIDYGSTTVKVGQGSTLAITMASKENKLSEVVVTAYGIKKNKNQLPYAAQQISGSDVSKIRTANAVSGLSGKISGLNIIQGNGIGSSTNVVIRGVKSLTGNNQALFVVDGVPVNNANTNSGNERTGRGGYDYGNAGADINPDDVESYNVLKGAAASALYGSRGANGVIMITTKKAKRGMGITVNTGVTVGQIDKTTMPTYQTEYGVGYSSSYVKDGFLYFDVDGDGQKDLVVATSEDASYGTKFDPNLTVFQWDAFDPTSPYYHKGKPWVAAANNPTTFYETAVSNNQSIFLNGANDKGSYNLGFTRNAESGTIPNSSVVKNIVNFGATYNITDKLQALANVNYSVVNGNGRYGTGYSGLNVNQNFRQWYQVSTDVQDQKAAYERRPTVNTTWNWKNPETEAGLVPIYTDNYYWTRYQNGESDQRNRVFGNVSLIYNVAPWLNITGRISADNYAETQQEHIAVGSKATASYSLYNGTYNENNYDLLATFDKNLSTDFNLKALLGTNIRKTTYHTLFAATNGGLVVPGLYTLSNSKGAIAAPTESYRPEEVDGYFTGATLGYKNFLTLDGTFRRDISSTLPDGKNAYNYYAVSGSWLFSHHLSNVPWLTSGKLRVNYATVGNSAPWGSLYDVYDFVAPFGNALQYSLPGTQNNQNLVPELTKSKEAGLEMAFLRNRLGFDFSYFHTNTYNQIIPVAVSTATGYSNKYVNAGDIQNQGVELSMFGSPFKTTDFSWNINVNFATNNSKVLSLYADSKNLQLATFQGGISSNASLGEPFGVLKGRAIETLNGQKLVGDDGYYVATSTTTNVIANINPDWFGGIYNTFTYKGITLGFLIDMKHGGSLFSLDMYYSQYTGVLKESAGLNDLGNPERNDLANGGGVVFQGVTADGKPNTKRVTVDANSPTIPASEYVYDASFTKLREVLLSYQIPQPFVNKLKVIKSAELSLIGRNLWIISKNLPYSDPEENLSSGNIQGYQSGAYPTTRSIGINLNLKF
jgi:TonB-linked SusC/RagA family outer membrane protein